MSSLVLHETHRIIVGFPPSAAGTSDYVSMKNYDHLTAILVLDNATSVTGSAITTKQATNVAAAGAKTLALSTAWRNIDTGAADLLASFAVSSDTFTTVSTDNKNSLYVIEIAAADLDVSGGFDCIQVGNASGVATILAIIYILGGARFAAAAADQPTPTSD